MPSPKHFRTHSGQIRQTSCPCLRFFIHCCSLATMSTLWPFLLSAQSTISLCSENMGDKKILSIGLVCLDIINVVDKYPEEDSDSRWVLKNLHRTLKWYCKIIYNKHTDYLAMVRCLWCMTCHWLTDVYLRDGREEETHQTRALFCLCSGLRVLLWDH